MYMNKMNQFTLIMLSSVFAVACYAQAVTDVQETVSATTKSPCADIKDPVEKRKCFDQQVSFFFK